ncbi:hypothetical protein P43SY_005325 [Pythium insidiosum]|uniref:Vacuolar protein sorting-associated protein n=1 Tax=Pythium insidiosum TaxID=114742 RepID=A0AAD5LNE8_PYTIN|nr:hypothetical protein P43SY_005325 [Pythium insidiosum]
MLHDALQRDAIAAFQRAIATAADGAQSVRLIVDVSLQVVLEVLAHGAGGKQVFDALHISRIVAVDCARMTPDQVRVQLGLVAAGPASPVWPADVMTVLLLPPTLSVVRLLAATLAPSVTSEPLPCCALWMPRATPECALEMERQGLAGLVREGELSVGLLPVDRDVLSLAQEHVFAELYVHGQQHGLTQVARSLLALAALDANGDARDGPARFPSVVALGPFAQRVAHMLSMASSLSPSPSRRHLPPFDRVVLIDRMEDPLTMLLTPMTYEGLLDVLVGMTHGVVSYDRETEDDEADGADDGVRRVKLILNHRDDIFDEIRDVNINQLLSRRLAAIARRLVRQVRGHRQGPAANAAADDTPVASATLAQLTALLQKVPQLVSQKRSLAHHLELVAQIQRRSQDLALQRCVEAETAILSTGLKRRGLKRGATSGDAERLLEEVLLREPPLLDVFDVLRLLCLTTLTTGGLRDDRLQWYRQQLTHTFGYDVLPLLLQLEQLGLLSTRSTGLDYPKRRRELALLRGVIVEEEEDDDEEENGKRRQARDSERDQADDKAPDDIHFMFPTTGYAPMSVRLVQRALGLKFQRSSASHSRRDSTSTSAGASRVLVYFVGGVTVAELAAFRLLNRTQRECQFVVATTAIANGSRLLRSIGQR